LPPVEYPFHDRVITVTECGRLCLVRRKINLSTVLAGQNAGIKQVDDQIWQVSLLDYDLGFFDMDSCRVEPGPNPFGPRVLTM
jgi:putative transposase